MAAILHGVTAIFGVEDTSVSNCIVQGYTNDGEFNSEATVVDETGLTVTWRGNDRKTQISLDVIVANSAVPVLGASITVEVNAASSYTSGSASTTFTGWVTKISDKGANAGFSALSVTAVGYEGVV